MDSKSNDENKDLKNDIYDKNDSIILDIDWYGNTDAEKQTTGKITPEKRAAKELFRYLHNDSAEINTSKEGLDIYKSIFAKEDFKNMNLNENLLKALYKSHIEKPSKVQLQTIPYILNGDDIICHSESGSGKTITFTSGLLNKVEKGEGPQGLIVAPTRELSIQINDVVSKIANEIEISTHLILKGSSMNKTIAEVLIGTPGSILLAIKENVFRPEGIKIFVADEADVTMDVDNMGSTTIRVLRQLVNAQKIFFSATYNPSMLRIIKKFAPNAIDLLQEKNKKPEKIRLYHICIPKIDKIKILMELYELLSIGQSIVFCATKKMVDKLKDIFIVDLHTVSCIHGDMGENERQEIVKNFRSAKTKILISTDLFSRGMDIPQVNLIINYDLPIYNQHANLQLYLNRIGRSGRFGRNGFVIDFVTSDYEKDVVKRFANEIDSQSSEITIDALREIFEEFATSN
ncbi:Eukaryotic initiation factor 4A [Dictyocoela muelleri]|nr:Eukaryotic initiation factor 4A [Dictyocoela muelleri]